MTYDEARRLRPRQRIYHAITGQEWIVNGWPRSFYTPLQVSIRRGSWFERLTEDNLGDYELRPDTSTPLGTDGQRELVARKDVNWGSYEIRNPRDYYKPVVGFLHEADGQLTDEGRPVYVARSTDGKLHFTGPDVDELIEQFKQAHFENRGLTG